VGSAAWTDTETRTTDCAPKHSSSSSFASPSPSPTPAGAQSLLSAATPWLHTLPSSSAKSQQTLHNRVAPSKPKNARNANRLRAQDTQRSTKSSVVHSRLPRLTFRDPHISPSRLPCMEFQQSITPRCARLRCRHSFRLLAASVRPLFLS
jgi:hypothetical protein